MGGLNSRTRGLGKGQRNCQKWSRLRWRNAGIFCFLKKSVQAGLRCPTHLADKLGGVAMPRKKRRGSSDDVTKAVPHKDPVARAQSSGNEKPIGKLEPIPGPTIDRLSWMEASAYELNELECSDEMELT